MAIAQSTYGTAPAKGLPGQIANEEKCNKVSREVESAAGILFGQPAYRGAADHGIVIGGTFAATGAGSEPVSGNVGTSTITDAPTVVSPAKQGRYTFVQTATSGTSPVLVYDPNGVLVGEGVVGSAITADGITATITAAGTATAGDTFYVDVTYTANARFVGLAVLTNAVPPVATGSSLVDGYPQYFTGAFMTMGQMYVTAGAAVNDGDDVYWNPATKRYTANAGHIRIPNATFDTSGGDGDIVEISLKLR
jgi:hypothetical protein